MKLEKLEKYRKNPFAFFDRLTLKNDFRWMPDELYLKLKYRGRTGRRLNLEQPTLFGEKLQWLKLYHRRPEHVQMVDKAAAKCYVADAIGASYVIPTYGVWERWSDIDWEGLPDRFVLKCTHDSGGVVICKDKASFDRAGARDKLMRCLKRNFYYYSREWPYREVRPRILAEEYLENDADGLHDYKVWCFHGEPRYIQYVTGRIGSRTYESFYDTAWRRQAFSFHNPVLEEAVPRPERLEELLRISRVLSKNQPFLRCDFYILEDGSIRFGEMTFFPQAGFELWKPEEYDLMMGSMITIQA